MMISDKEKADKTARKFLNIAGECLHNHDFDGAISNLDKAISLNPSSAAAFNNRALAWGIPL